MRFFIFLIGISSVLLSCKEKDKKSEARKIAPYTIEQFYKSINVFGGFFSSDDSKLLVTSNESGIFNAYEIDVATGGKRAITTSTKESIFANDFVPGTENFIYNSDKGGDENDHLFLKRTDGTIKELTPGVKEKAQFYSWSRDKKSMYYTSNRRNPRYFDLYKMDTSGWKPLMIYKNDNGFDVGAFSDNERYFILVQNLTTSSNNIFLVDQQTKQTKKINSDSVPSNNQPLQFSMDNNSFYYTTDEGSEFQHLVKYDIPTGKTEKVYETNWDVVFMAISENEKFRVIYVNEDGRNKLLLFDHKSGKEISFPKIEDGDIQNLAISISEKKMRLGVGNSKSPNNIYVYDFESKDLKRVTNTLNPEIKEADLVSAEVVRYKSFDGMEIPAIYYKPQQADNNNRVPALVWVHGGPGGQSRLGYSSLIQYLVNHGYAVLAVNNRGSSGYGKTFYKMDDRNHGEKDLQDCVWGKKYLQSLPYVDSSKIGITGGSYGGYMTLAALCFQPEEFKVGVDQFGVANWLRTLREIPPYWESFKKALYEEIGDPNTTDTIRLKKFSPLLNAGNINKPLMVLQGANDPRVLKVESDEIVSAVKKNNVPVEYVIFRDEGHGFVKKENQIKGYSQILQFLDKYLKREPAKTKLN